MTWISSVTAKVKTEYGLTEKFKITRGVPQGSPLSPILYIIAFDVLHELLHEHTKGTFVFQTPINSLGYADDTTTVSDSAEDIEISHKIVTQFFKDHGLKLNPTKSVHHTLDCETKLEPYCKRY